ncbi:MAG: hypothetical protein K1Y36_16140 [Blastocatellia bacterium]|nr:hypothetical protein [Blastocatellia bacterium]
MKKNDVALPFTYRAGRKPVSHFTERLGMHMRHNPDDDPPLTPFQNLMAAIRKRFGTIPNTETQRIKRLDDEQQEHLLDVVVQAESLEFFLAQIPVPEPPASGGGNQRGSRSNAFAPFNEPPLIPADNQTLAQAIEMLSSWREISSDRQVRWRLKALLSRFPENNYQAGLWFQHLKEIQAGRERALLPVAEPEPETEAGAEREPADLVSERAAEPVWFQPEETPATPMIEMEMSESMAAKSEIETVFERITDEPSVRPLPTPDLVVTPVEGDAGLQVKSNLVFTVPLGHPFSAELRVMHTRSASVEGKRRMVLVLDVPEEDLHFAQGVARRVDGFVSLEDRLKDTITSYFLDAEHALTVRPAPVQTPPPAPTIQAVAESYPSLEPQGERVKTTISPKAPSLVEPARPGRGRPRNPILVKKSGETIAISPSSSNQPEPNATARRTYQSRKPAELKAAETRFRKNFKVLTQAIKTHCGSVRRAFTPTSDYLVKSILKGTTIPQPPNFLKILKDLATLPAEQRQGIRPELTQIIEDYQAVRGGVESYATVKGELDALISALAAK